MNTKRRAQPVAVVAEPHPQARPGALLAVVLTAAVSEHLNTAVWIHLEAVLSAGGR